jgi:hypothetical protein
MMSDLQREALAVLAELLTLSPEVRIGQLMAHIGFLGEAHLGEGLGYLDDDELLAILYRHRAELTARLQEVPGPTVQPTGAGTSVSGSPTLVEPAPGQ